MKKIMAVSLLGRERVKAMSVWDGDVLVISEIEKITGMFERWKKPLITEMREKSNDGFGIYVEDRSGKFCEHGFQFSFDEIDYGTGRPYQSLAMDEYMGLTSLGDFGSKRRGNIVVGGGLERFFFSDDMMNISYDERGRSKYDLDQSRLTGSHRAVLISVLAAKVFHTQSESDLKRFAEYLDEADDRDSLARTLDSISRRGID